MQGRGTANESFFLRTALDIYKNLSNLQHLASFFPSILSGDLLQMVCCQNTVYISSFIYTGTVHVPAIAISIAISFIE